MSSEIGKQPYRRPPITEAVIEIRFAAPIPVATMAKVNTAFAPVYPNQRRMKQANVQLLLEENATAQINQEEGQRRSSQDETEILLLWRTTFLISQLPPYPGWPVFFDRFVRDWEIWKRVAGYNRIIRVGVRYVNRIDIPISGPLIEYENYLKVYPHLPDAFSSVMAYGIQVQIPIPEIGCRLLINSASVPSPIIGHASYLLDQDISKELDTPQQDEDLYDLLGRIRAKKNEVFEVLITQQARELFRK